MFSKQAKSASNSQGRIEPLPTSMAIAPVEAARRSPPKVASLLSADLTIEGNLTGEGELQIDGVVKGDVRVGRLTVGETGHIEGSIYAEAVEVRGRVVGAITSKQVRLYGTSYIDGDITHEQLAMETGAFFQGRSLKFQRPAPAAQPAPQAEPLALAKPAAG
ncbi:MULTISPECIES: polymer-forming cytoskeletal protein [unclassified Caulobacter]|jgi:cytoskeletal protein CcmA (bactofilin family)|uniref:bactofilin family protein n=1 Tax=unclassified Caulobacter TaxID=2648921 RepID=UPI0006F6E96B|nr:MULTISPECIES: polymer-forming cytoskeletal protein [unclassified Caulobacter]KQV57187.1 cell shape determination protein CcmA [Caulobacter sp. Root342]KQV66759.1 cell shape determination protein CcmA [Caulobacter sp. Root343]